MLTNLCATVLMLLLNGCIITSAQPSFQQINGTSTMPTMSPTEASEGSVSLGATTQPTSSPIIGKDSITPYPTYTPRRSLSPTYHRSYPSPSYNQPFRPSYPSGSYYDDNNGEEEEEKSFNITTGAIVVIILVFITLAGICYGRSQFSRELDRDEVDSFYTNLYKTKWLVLPIPAMFGRSACKSALFFTTRIKILWVKPLAILQFVIGWIACFSTLFGFIYPRNVTNNSIGTASLFLSELVLHVWYGYIRYWNPSWLFLKCDPDWEDNLEYARNSLDQARRTCTQLYHRDREYVERETSTWIIVVGHIFSIPLHVASVVGSCLACLALSILGMVGCNKGGFEGNVRWIGIITAVIGSLAYPILFGVGGLGIKILASIGHHICLECYEARHFGKTSKEFLSFLMLKPFVDFALDELGIPDLDQHEPEDKDIKSSSKDKNNDTEDLDLSNDNLPTQTTSDDSDEYPVTETKSTKKEQKEDRNVNTTVGTVGGSCKENKNEVNERDVETGKVGDEVADEPYIETVDEVADKPDIEIINEAADEPDIEIMDEIVDELDIEIINEVNDEPDIEIVNDDGEDGEMGEMSGRTFTIFTENVFRDAGGQKKEP